MQFEKLAINYEKTAHIPNGPGFLMPFAGTDPGIHLGYSYPYLLSLRLSVSSRRLTLPAHFGEPESYSC